MITMSKGKLLKLDEALDRLSRVAITKFAYAVAQNRRRIFDEVQAIKASNNPSKAFMEYEQKRFEIVKKYARYEGGKMVELPDKTVALVDYESFSKEYGELSRENSEILEERNRQLEQFNELLKEEHSFDPFLINWKYAPADLRADELEPIIDLMDGNPNDIIMEKKESKNDKAG